MEVPGVPMFTCTVAPHRTDTKEKIKFQGLFVNLATEDAFLGLAPFLTFLFLSSEHHQCSSPTARAFGAKDTALLHRTGVSFGVCRSLEGMGCQC